MTTTASSSSGKTVAPVGPMTPTATAGRPSSTKLGRDWRLLCSASTISVLGDGAFVGALPLLATRITHDPRLISGLTMAGTLPWLVFSLYSGVVADRSEGRRLLMRAQLGQLLAVALVGAVAAFSVGGMWVLYVLAFGLGIGASLAKSAAQTLLPSVIPAELLVTANGRLFTWQSVAQQFIGPALGSALFVAAPLLPFWVDAATFALSVALIARLPRGSAAVERTGSTRRRDLRDGLGWLARHRLVRTTTLLSAAANFANVMAFSTMVLYVGSQYYGLLLSVAAVGGILGGLTSRRVIARFGELRVVRTTITVTPLTLFGCALLGPNPIAMGLLTALGSTCGSLWNVAVVSNRQRLVPAHLRGRVSSAGTMITWGAQPLGALAGGLVAARFGLAAPWLVGGAIRLTAALCGLRALGAWNDFQHSGTIPAAVG
jgi:MFS family permease